MANRRRINDTLEDGESESSSSQSGSFSIRGEDGKPLPIKKLEGSGNYFTITIPKPSPYNPKRKYSRW